MALPLCFTDMIEKEYSFKHMRFQEAPLLGPGAGFTPYSEFHPPAEAGWKPTPGPGLMKDPPIAARNGPTNFVTQSQSQGSVMMVYGLDNDTSNTDKLFNLVCLYGNVARVSVFLGGSVYAHIIRTLIVGSRR